MQRQREHRPRLAPATLAVVAVVFATGFAPFNGDGLAEFRVLQGAGALAEVDPEDARWREVETDVLFHTLSSRYGGGGVLAYMEFLPVRGVAGALIIDLRHAGLRDLASSHLILPDTRRADLHYQEWKGRTDLFVADRAEGSIEVVDIYRGQGVSAIAISYDLLFYDKAGDWRRVVGTATTSPTVEQALRRDGDGLYRSETTGESDGDIIVDCFGATYVEETHYEEDSYVVEDEGSSCEGDTWEDDAEDPSETSGCAGKRQVDEGEPDADGGCDDSGPDVSDPTDPDPAYDESSGEPYDDESGCDEDTDTTNSDPDSDGDDNEDLDCSGDSAEAATLPASELAGLRRTLDAVARGENGRSTRRASAGRFSREGYRTVRKILSYLPFMVLGFVIHLMRRRMGRA